MMPSRPPFRADHVGSLLRSPALKALRFQKEEGVAGAEALAVAEDAAIRDVVALQEDIGLEGISGGELRRQSLHMDFLLQLCGLASEVKTNPVTFHAGPGAWRGSRRSARAVGEAGPGDTARPARGPDRLHPPVPR